MPSLVLLPGMDGTGELFAEFVRALPDAFSARVVSYPRNEFLNYEALAEYVSYHLIFSEPYILIAESFSSPIAVRIAATHPSNLKALVICCGFVRSPIRESMRWIVRYLVRYLGPVLMRLPLPAFVVRSALVGAGASDDLVSRVQHAIRQVESGVLAGRLREILNCDCRTELKGVRVPVLYLRATEDLLVGEASFVEMLAIKPEIAVAGLSGPHLLLQAKSGPAGRVVADFVERVSV